MGLKLDIFCRLCVGLTNPTLTFLHLGSSINLKKMISFRQDPNAIAVTAFSIS